MNILIVSTGFPSESANSISAKFVLHEANSYALNGAKVKVLVPFYRGALTKEIVGEGIEVIRFRYFWPFNQQKLVDPVNNIYDGDKIIKFFNIPFFIVSFYLSVLKHSKNIDIVHCQWTPTVLFVLPFRFFRKFKIVTTARGSDIRLLPKWLNRFIMKQVDASINCYGPQEWNLSTMNKFPSNYIKLPLIVEEHTHHQMPNDLAKIFKENEKSFKIVYLGRIDSIKETVNSLPISLLIEAIIELKETFLSEVTLIYIGDGDLKNDLVQKVKLNNLEGSVYFLGNKTNPSEYLPYFDLGIGGSWLNAVSQEMSILGLPQIQTSYTTENNLQIFTHLFNCLLFEPNNLDELVDCIKIGVNQTTLLNEIGIQSTKFIKEYVDYPKEGGAKYLNEFYNLIKKDKDE